MKLFLGKQLKYPKEALENKIEGTVHVEYFINYKGKVIDAKNISSLGYGCDEEALRIVKLLKFVVPKNPRKLRIKFRRKIQIHFNLPKKPAPSKKVDKYAVKLTKAEDSKPSKSYNYTIEW